MPADRPRHAARPVAASCSRTLQIACLALLGTASTSQPTCPSDASLRVDVTGGSVTASNGFVCVGVSQGTLTTLQADFAGTAKWGANVLAANGMTLQAEDGNGVVTSSAGSTTKIAVLANTSSLIEVQISGISVGSIASEVWTISVEPGKRTITLHAAGTLTSDSRTAALRGVRRQWETMPSSIYAMFQGGMVQMKGAPPGLDFFPSSEPLERIYALGGWGSDDTTWRGNMSWDLTLLDGNLTAASRATRQQRKDGTSGAVHNSPVQTVIMSSGSGVPYWSGIQQVVAGGLPAASEDTWMKGWQGAPAAGLPPTAWSHTMRIGANNLDFPVGWLPNQLDLPADDVHAAVMGAYASPAGCLCTHKNEVQQGYTVGQIATTIARPSRGYEGTYNYFDPDNYLSTNALLGAGDIYLQEQVRLVIERSGDFLKPSGQLPHHFVGLTPTYEALSGEIQTGPNVFWILSAFSYAKATQNITWLQNYMPKLRLASEFLFGLIDEDIHLAYVPGSLMIDVFIRNNYTSDTNAELVGFFREFADAEDAVGNATGAARLRSLASRVATAMNTHLWDHGSNDHYITQWDGPVLNTTRDFVDYDANLIAAAHGIPSADQAAAVFRRIDGGRCRASSTFVSEKYYGINDTTHGNTGDSWTAMGRIAWFGALARKRFQDEQGFVKYDLQPLQDELIRSTWMHERQFCNGTQQPNRTAMYFEYPAVVAMMIRHVKYGIELGYQSIKVSPFTAPDSFSYSFGDVLVAYEEGARVTIRTPAPGGSAIFGIELHRVQKSTSFSVASTCGGESSEASSEDGVLTFTAIMGSNCTVTATASQM